MVDDSFNEIRINEIEQRLVLYLYFLLCDILVDVLLIRFQLLIVHVIYLHYPAKHADKLLITVTYDGYFVYIAFDDEAHSIDINFLYRGCPNHILTQTYLSSHYEILTLHNILRNIIFNYNGQLYDVKKLRKMQYHLHSTLFSIYVYEDMPISYIIIIACQINITYTLSKTYLYQIHNNVVNYVNYYRKSLCTIEYDRNLYIYNSKCYLLMCCVVKNLFALVSYSNIDYG